ncbi:hypothetical protein NW768_007037 [Fusarium equiseti]|uniref:CCHC-type domain-containing protein n=1 Tax=Fusarium equiseti TaxID=61235 RepID=A0ABQ8RA14_FUSEQ|nr:hypothetical protein NW768_007037 [Fusarium equiseti]
MSYNSTQLGNLIGEAFSLLQKNGSLGDARRGGGGRRGGRGGGRKRCFHCDSEEHLVKDCPRKAKRVAQETQQEASPPRETPPAPVERSGLPSPPPPAAATRPSTCPTVAQSPVQETTEVRVGIILPSRGPQFAPPPVPKPLTGRPPARLGRTIEFSELFNRWYYVHYLDGSMEWYEEQR